MSEIEALIAKLEAWRQPPDPWSGVSEPNPLAREAVAALRSAQEEIERLRGGGRSGRAGYFRVVKAFDEDETANSFLSEDGEGGFAAGVYRMADEIRRLRALLTKETSDG